MQGMTSPIAQLIFCRPSASTLQQLFGPGHGEADGTSRDGYGIHAALENLSVL
jgi:hypothetical protein